MDKYTKLMTCVKSLKSKRVKPILQDHADFAIIGYDDGFGKRASRIDINTCHRECIVETGQDLYDTLISVCQGIKRNVMLYDTVQLGSTSPLYSTVIELKHGVDEDVFFLKMYMEALGDG